jgi:uncharacterized protein YqhQ
VAVVVVDGQVSQVVREVLVVVLRVVLDQQVVVVVPLIIQVAVAVVATLKVLQILVEQVVRELLS